MHAAEAECIWLGPGLGAVEIVPFKPNIVYLNFFSDSFIATKD